MTRRAKPSQRDRALAAMRRHGTVCAVDFMAPTIDGGPPITRLAARIDELRAVGHVIVAAGWRHKTRVYRLEREATVPADIVDTPAADALFAETIGAPSPRSPYAEDMR